MQVGCHSIAAKESVFDRKRPGSFYECSRLVYIVTWVIG